MQRPELSLVVPVYNEQPQNLQLLIERLRLVMKPLLMFYEVVFVDDGSREDVKATLRALADEHSYIKVVTLSRNFGEQAAISAGLANALGDVVVNMDSDLQDPPELIPAMLQYWREGYDVVYTRQADREESFVRQLQAKVFYYLLDRVSYIRIPRDAGEFRLMSRRAVDALVGLPEGQRFLRGLVPWIGFKSVIIPFKRGARQLGESAYTMRKLLALAVQGFMSFSVIPLMAMPVLYIFSSLLILTTVAMNEVFHFVNLSPALVLTVVLLSNVFQALCFIFLGVYLIQLLSEAKGRPTFIVQDIYQSASLPQDREAPMNVALLEQV